MTALIIIAAVIAGAVGYVRKYRHYAALWAVEGHAESHRRHPELYKDADYARRQRKNAVEMAKFDAIIWPFVLMSRSSTSRIERVAFAADMEAEAELERAKLYAEAKRIRQEADAKELPEFDRKLKDEDGKQ